MSFSEKMKGKKLVMPACLPIIVHMVTICMLDNYPRYITCDTGKSF